MATATSGTATREPLTKDDVSARAGEQISVFDEIVASRWSPANAIPSPSSTNSVSVVL